MAQNEFQLLIVTGNFGFRNSDFVLKNFFHGKSKFAIRNSKSEIHNRTYSNSKGLPLMPVAGGAIQLAILPGSVTGCIKLRTYSRSSTLGSHSPLRRSNSSCEIRLPSRSKW